MGEERLEILRMVAEKLISVEEAERLLKAVEEADQRRRTEEPCSPFRKTSFGSALGSIGDALSGIGPMIRDSVEEMVMGVEEEEEGDLETESPTTSEGKFVLAPGAEIEVRGDRRLFCATGDLELVGTDSEWCEIFPATGAGSQVRRRNTRVFLLWLGGDLKVRVPKQVRRVRVVTVGGNIRIADLPCELDLKPMSGAVTLKKISKGFRVRTLGGNVHLEFAPSWAGQGRASTLGGVVTAVFPPGISTDVRAGAVGGRVEFDPSLGAVDEHRQPGKHRLEMTIGNRGSRSSLRLESMGGDVRLLKGAS